MRKQFVNFSRLAPLKYYRDGNMKQMTYFDFKDKNRYNIYSRYIEECKAMCPDSECLKELVITNIGRSALGPLNFYQALSDNPSFVVHSDPKVNLPDFLTLVMSCFGTWFGLSILSFNPLKWKKNDSHSKDTQNYATQSIHNDTNDTNGNRFSNNVALIIKYQMLVRKIERTNRYVEIILKKMDQHGW